MSSEMKSILRIKCEEKILVDLLDPNLLSDLRGLLDIVLSVCNSVKSLELSLFAFSQKLELTQEIGGEILWLVLQG